MNMKAFGTFLVSYHVARACLHFKVWFKGSLDSLVEGVPRCSFLSMHLGDVQPCSQVMKPNPSPLLTESTLSCTYGLYTPQVTHIQPSCSTSTNSLP